MQNTCRPLQTTHKELMNGVHVMTGGLCISHSTMENAYRLAWEAKYAVEFNKTMPANNNKLGQAWEATAYNAARALRIMHFHFSKQHHGTEATE
jgi:hypothetical protein